VVKAMCASGADAIVLAGDVATGPKANYRKVLRPFAEFASPKLLVPGNHDLWSIARRPDTQRRYRETLRHTAEANGFHYLPGNPIVIKGVGFVGTVGWYDYSLRQLEPPKPGTRVTPLCAERTREGPELRRNPSQQDVPWEELTEADYACQALMWSQDDVWKQLVWNDALYVDWGQGDANTVRRLAGDLEADIAAIEPRVDYWVRVSHFVPFAELVGEASEEVEEAYGRAFRGSPVLGQVFASHPKCRLVLCGHRHRPQVLSIGDLVAANCSVGDGKSGPLLLSL